MFLDMDIENFPYAPRVPICAHGYSICEIRSLISSTTTDDDAAIRRTAAAAAAPTAAAAAGNRRTTAVRRRRRRFPRSSCAIVANLMPEMQYINTLRGTSIGWRGSIQLP